MFREITLGQYYPVDSVVHGLDPRTKLFGTMVFIASLFIADNIWGYVIATLVLSAAIKITKVPFRFIVRGLKAIMILLIISVLHIMNSISSMVLSRRHEFGILRAMGISDRGYMLMILKEALRYGIYASLVMGAGYVLARRFLLYMMQKVDTGTVDVTRKVRSAVFAAL